MIHENADNKHLIVSGSRFRCAHFKDVHTAVRVHWGWNFVCLGSAIYSDAGWYARTIEQMKSRTGRIPGYLSAEGEQIMDWRGRCIAHVVLLKPAKHNMIPDPNYYTFRAKDMHGGYWYGRGSKGMAITLKPAKGELK